MKSNRLALMWGAPFGLGLALFAEDLVQFAIGERWRPGDRAHAGDRRRRRDPPDRLQLGRVLPRAGAARSPSASRPAIAIVAFLASRCRCWRPTACAGLALATLLVEGVNFAVRMFYLRRLFPTFRFIRHTARALLPSVPAVGDRHRACGWRSARSRRCSPRSRCSRSTSSSRSPRRRCSSARCCARSSRTCAGGPRPARRRPRRSSPLSRACGRARA